jgi:kumamolisin
MASKAHVILPGSRRPKDPLAKRIGPVDPKEKIDVTLGLAGPKLPGANEYVNQRLTPEELAEKFGTQKANADKVAKALKKFGIKVDNVHLATQSMRVSGTAAALEAAFKPDWAMMRSPTQGEYRGREGPVYIPKDLKGLVDGVFGLDERIMARRKARATAAAAALAPLGPADLEQRYNFPPGNAAGQSVAIAEFGGGYFADDMTAYCNKFQRPVPNVRPISVDAPAYTLKQIQALPPRSRATELDNSIEVMMDVQIVAGLCPKAQISVYFSAFDQGGWVNLLDEVIAAKPAVLSVSWGLAEEDTGWSKGAIDAINDRLNAARLLGITVCASSGDDGSGDQLDDGKAHIDFPSSSPFALAVGGTMLEGSGARVKEVTWWEAPGRRTNNGGGSTGGGVSMHFQRPTWQNVKVKSLNSGSIDGRITPDIAALAGDPMYDLIFIGQDQPNGGTSASTPLWASLIARIGGNLPAAKQQRFLTPLLYQPGSTGQPIGKSCSRDITSGDNTSTPPGKGYKAGVGFDAVTGWGVPDGVKLQDALAAV